jgi:hypothetical protein
MEIQDFLRNFAIGCVSTAIAEISTIPICTTKTVYQTSNHATIRQSVSHIIERNGLRGFFTSAPIASTNQVISQSLKYSLFYFLLGEQNYHKSPENHTPFYKKVFAGVGAGVIVSIVSHPVDICRVIIQRNESIKYEFMNHGWRRFYFGIHTNWLKVCISSSCFMPIFKVCEEQGLSAFNSSLVSAAVSTVIMHPVDYIKTMKMANKPIQITKQIFTKGLSIHLLRIIPHFVMTMTIAQYLREQ